MAKTTMPKDPRALAKEAARRARLVLKAQRRPGTVITRYVGGD